VRARKTSDAILLTIEDTGCGIAKDALKNLGNPFEQVENQFTKSHKGSGLGFGDLALAGAAARRRIEDQVESPVIGTIVSVRVPAVKKPPRRPDQKRARAGARPPPDYFFWPQHCVKMLAHASRVAVRQVRFQALSGPAGPRCAPEGRPGPGGVSFSSKGPSRHSRMICVTRE
jgi:hypothetical protein